MEARDFQSWCAQLRVYILAGGNPVCEVLSRNSSSNLEPTVVTPGVKRRKLGCGVSIEHRNKSNFP